jgi:hypothetical protein
MRIFRRRHHTAGLLCSAACLLPLALPSALHAQGARVVVSDTTGGPVSYAVVRIANGVSMVADDSGRVELRVPEQDSLRISARRLGFGPFLGWIPRGTDGLYRVTLKSIVERAGAVRIVATRDTPLARTGFYERMQRVQQGAASARFFTPEELDQRNPGSTTQVLQGENMIRVKQTSDGRRLRAALAGRNGNCAMTILLDGRRVVGTLEETIEDPRADARSLISIDDLIPAGSIAAIELYGSASAVPGELQQMAGSKMGCGLIAIWSGSRR